MQDTQKEAGSFHKLKACENCLFVLKNPSLQSSKIQRYVILRASYVHSYSITRGIPLPFLKSSSFIDTSI